MVRCGWLAAVIYLSLSTDGVYAPDVEGMDMLRGLFHAVAEGHVRRHAERC